MQFSQLESYGLCCSLPLCKAHCLLNSVIYVYRERRKAYSLLLTTLGYSCEPTDLQYLYLSLLPLNGACVSPEALPALLFLPLRPQQQQRCVTKVFQCSPGEPCDTTRSHHQSQRLCSPKATPRSSPQAYRFHLPLLRRHRAWAY